MRHATSLDIDIIRRKAEKEWGCPVVLIRSMYGGVDGPIPNLRSNRLDRFCGEKKRQRSHALLSSPREELPFDSLIGFARWILRLEPRRISGQPPRQSGPAGAA